MTNERNLNTAEIPEYDVMFDRNLVAYALATADCQQYNRGLDWYPTARQDCQQFTARLIGDGIKISEAQFSNVVSIVSPGRNWKKNPIDAYATCLAWIAPTEEARVEILSEYRVSRRYGLPAFRRAWSLLDGNYQIAKKTAPKTYSFADNLLLCTLSSEVTVDQHNCHILLGESDIFGSIGISAAQYRRLVAPMYAAAAAVGLHHTQFQSILWNWRWENMQTI